MTIGDALRRCYKNYPNKLAVKDEYGKHFPAGTNLTFAELGDAVNRLANGLLSIGLKPGDRVSVMTGTGLGHFLSELALVTAGMVISPVDHTYMPREIEYQVRDAGSRAFIVDEDIYEGKVKGVASAFPGLAFIGIGEGDACQYRLSQLVSEGSAEDPDVAVDEGDIATLVYTSGTTGAAKGVPLSHRAWLHSAGAIAAEHGVHPYTRWLLIMPMHTSGGTGLSISSAVIGCSLILSNPDPEKVLDIIAREKITFSQFSPTLLANIVRHPKAKTTDFSSFERWFTTAAPISAELLTEGARFLGKKFTQPYGTTETALMGTILRPEDVALEGPKRSRLTSVGKAGWGFMAKVVDEEGMEVGPGGTGELAIAGPAVAKGYWNRPDAEDFRDGWWYSGDIVRVDEDGFYHVVDRKKDMILSGGTNIYPREVEDVIASHPAVALVSVVGVPDEKWGESVKAVIVLREGMTATEEEIIDFCKERMAAYKKPKSVDFIPMSEMPVMGGGYKVLRRELRDRYRRRYEAARAGKVESWGAV